MEERENDNATVLTLTHSVIKYGAWLIGLIIVLFFYFPACFSFYTGTFFKERNRVQ